MKNYSWLFFSIILVLVSCSNNSDRNNSTVTTSENLSEVSTRLFQYDWFIDTVRTDNGRFQPLWDSLNFQINFEDDAQFRLNIGCVTIRDSYTFVNDQISFEHPITIEATCIDVSTLRVNQVTALNNLLGGDQIILDLLDSPVRLIAKTTSNEEIVFSGYLKDENDVSLPITLMGFGSQPEGHQPLTSGTLIINDNETYQSLLGNLQSTILSLNNNGIDFESSMIVALFEPENLSGGGFTTLLRSVVERNGETIIQIVRNGFDQDSQDENCEVTTDGSSPYSIYRIDSTLPIVIGTQRSLDLCTGLWLFDE